MSVLACGRYGCDNIMCDDLIQNVGHESYICHGCLRELEVYRMRWYDQYLTVEDVPELVRRFMATPPGVFSGAGRDKREEISKALESLIRRRDPPKDG